jgi:hypothetical protein
MAQETDTLEITYTASLKDKSRAHEYAVLRGRRWIRMAAAVMVGLMMAVAADWLITSGPFRGLLPLPHLYAIAIAAFVIIMVVTAVKHAEALGTGGADARQTMRITPEALIHRANGQETWISWTGIETVAQSKDVVIIMKRPELGDPGRLSRVYGIPITAFSGQASAWAFTEALERRWSVASDDGPGPMSADTPADATFRVTLEDVAQWYDYKSPGHGKSRKASHGWDAFTWLLLWATVGYIVYESLIHPSWRILWPGLRFLSVVMLVLAVISWLQAAPRRRWWPFHVKPGTFDQVSVTATPEGLIRETGRERVSKTWPSIAKIEVNDRMIFLTDVDRNVVFVPLRAFASPSLADDFLRRAHRYAEGLQDDADDGVWPPPPQIRREK